MASTSHSRVEESASTSGRSYDVFINHRGPDVKHTLAAKIYNMLTCGLGLSVFLDDKEFELGDNLPTELDAAIKSASLHIAIFSENYAQSRWCLDELSLMHRTGTKIVPIFFHVKPDDVRYAKGVYAAAFQQHRKKRRHTPRTIREWKDALFNVSNNIGHIVNDEKDEDMLLKNITYCVRSEFKKLPLVVAEHAVGLDEIVKDFELTALQSAGMHHNAQMVGIWGMGGSGKTTLAKKLYNNIYPSMERASLILDVRDAANKNMLFEKQKKLLQDLGFKSVSVDNIEEGKAILTSNLRSIRALIILDDVDHVDQLNALVPGQGSESLIGSDTLIIVTTREFEVLRLCNISSLYKMKPLSTVYAKQLFCWHAFLQPSPQDGFEELVDKFLKACSGLPLSVKVLGGQLYGNSSKKSWKSLLDKISKFVDKDIKDRLKISYDVLDDEEKDVFLDIACFFIGEKKDVAIEVWNGIRSSGLHNLEKLRNKCLVEIDEEDYIRMHDHLRDLGKEIANRKSPYGLWSSQQNIEVCNEQIGIGIRRIMAESAEAFGDCSSHNELVVNTNRGILTLRPSTLGLQFIVARGPNLNHVISEAPRDLVWLRWINSGQTSLQSVLPLTNLRVLELVEDLYGHHLLQRLWVADCDAPLQLRELVINKCTELQGIPKSIGRLTQLRKLVLDEASHLESLPEELGLLQSLEHLEIKNCKELLSLPNSMGNLRNLRSLNLYLCRKLGRLPDSCKELTLLRKLVLDEALHLESLPEELGLLQSLEHLEIKNCKELLSLPNSMGNLRNVRRLNLYLCRKLGRLPDSCKELTLLQHLDLSLCFNITFRADIMQKMSKLEYLSFEGCNQVVELPLNIPNQASLRELNLKKMWKLMDLPGNIGQLSKLRKLIVGGELLTSLPASLGDLSSLTTLLIYGCSKLQSLPDSLGRLRLLERLEIRLSGVKYLPKSINQLINLESLLILGCPAVNEFDLGAGSSSSSLCKLKTIDISQNDELSKICIPKDCCTGLETLKIEYNKNLREIESLPSSVRRLVIIGCPKLSALPSFAQLISLREFELRGCYEVQKIEGVHHCRELEVLKVYTRWEVPSIQILECMERLGTLHLAAMGKSVVDGCIQSLQKWPGEIIVCTRAVQNAASIVNSLAFPSLSAVDSCSNVEIDWAYGHELVLKEEPTNGNAIIVCFVISTPRVAELKTFWYYSMPYSRSPVAVQEGRWVWIGVFSQRSHRYRSLRCKIIGQAGTVEKGFLGMVEEDRVREVFLSLMGVMEI